MRAVDQWRLIEAELPDGWEEARLSFVVEDPTTVSAAAGVLGPLGPGRVGQELRFQVLPSGSAGAHKLSNLLGHLDRKRLWGTLSLRDVSAPSQREERVVSAATGTATSAPAPKLADAWDALVRSLPPDWSDLLCRLELDSTDYLARAALLGAPLNPTRTPGESELRFRVSGKSGYGASPLMVRRCLERMDGAGLTGSLEVVNALSDTENVATQGPVWRVAGRSV
jgi:hypothetical protein